MTQTSPSLGLASSGPHANGFSLIRKIIKTQELDYNTSLGEKSLGDTLLTPTRIYVKSLLALHEKVDIKALAHITGGGLLENIPRVLPDPFQAQLNKDAWEIPAIFPFLQKHGNLAEQEMLRTFNCGIGMVICIAEDQVQTSMALLEKMGETVWQIGVIQERPKDGEVCVIQ